MTDNTCNGWRNAATWTVNLWFGDSWTMLAEDGIDITPEVCRADVEEHVFDVLGRAEGTSGFIWDMLDLNAVDWDQLAEHHATEEEGADA